MQRGETMSKDQTMSKAQVYGGGRDKLSETTFSYFKSSKAFCFQMVYFIFLLCKMNNAGWHYLIRSFASFAARSLRHHDFSIVC